MTGTLYTIAAFIFAIAVLIAVHEYGHFIVARRLGVKVEKFSIGFGPSLLSWRSRDGEVEYVIAAIPLGGYVKMLGETPAGQTDEAKAGLSEADRARSFDVQPVWKRAAIAVAGPTFNILFAVVAYTVIGWVGQMVMPPIIGSVVPASIAEQSGITEGDLVRRVDDHDIHSWQQFEEMLKRHVGQDVALTIQRDEHTLTVKVPLPKPKQDELLVNVTDVSLGVAPGVRVYVDAIEEGSPAAAAGLRTGDRITHVQGKPVHTVRGLIEDIRTATGKRLLVGVERDGATLSLSVSPVAVEGGYGRIGVALKAESIHEPVFYRMGPIDGMVYGFARTWEMTVMTLQFLKKMATASISADNLGGPIAIAQMAGKTAEMGVITFLSFLAFISVNLAVLNLLPIPVLDGGHLVYLGIEKVRGRPLSPEVMARTQVVGMSLIILLMIFAFYNDLMRLFRG